MNKKVVFKDLGLISYQKAWDLQEKIHAEIVQTKIGNRQQFITETGNFLLFCEHPHVYTLGKSGKPNHLLTDEQFLAKNGIDYFPTNRGGDITYHGPGQIVGYPILDLDNFFTDIHQYLRYLEEAIIRMLESYGITAGRITGLTGVWIEPEGNRCRKIAAFGVRCSRWVTMHGFALNVNTDLSYFGNIIPCGIQDKAVTSMEKELGRKTDQEEVKDKLKIHLAELFGMTLIPDSEHIMAG